jgi:hypothetical protein
MNQGVPAVEEAMGMNLLEAMDQDVDGLVNRKAEFIWVCKECETGECSEHLVQRDTNACLNFIYFISYRALKGWALLWRPQEYTRAPRL